MKPIYHPQTAVQDLGIGNSNPTASDASDDLGDIQTDSLLSGDPSSLSTSGQPNQTDNSLTATTESPQPPRKIVESSLLENSLLWYGVAGLIIVSFAVWGILGSLAQKKQQRQTGPSYLPPNRPDDQIRPEPPRQQPLPNKPEDEVHIPTKSTVFKKYRGQPKPAPRRPEISESLKSKIMFVGWGSLTSERTEPASMQTLARTSAGVEKKSDSKSHFATCQNVIVSPTTPVQDDTLELCVGEACDLDPTLQHSIVTTDVFSISEIAQQPPLIVGRRCETVQPSGKSKS